MNASERKKRNPYEGWGGRQDFQSCLKELLRRQEGGVRGLLKESEQSEWDGVG